MLAGKSSVGFSDSIIRLNQQGLHIDSGLLIGIELVSHYKHGGMAAEEADACVADFSQSQQHLHLLFVQFFHYRFRIG